MKSQDKFFQAKLWKLKAYLESLYSMTLYAFIIEGFEMFLRLKILASAPTDFSGKFFFLKKKKSFSKQNAGCNRCFKTIFNLNFKF